MKKIYLNPTTDIVTIEVAKIIAASNPKPEGFAEDLDQTGGDGGNALSRRSVWDDEEEDEEDLY